MLNNVHVQWIAGVHDQELEIVPAGMIGLMARHTHGWQAQGTVTEAIKCLHAVCDGSKRPLLKLCDFGYSKDWKDSLPKSAVGTPGYAGFIPEGMPGFDARAVKGYSYNPAKAQQLLAEAGFPNGKGIPEILLSATTTYRDSTRATW